MTLSEPQKQLLDWLDKQEGYRVKVKTITEEFPAAEWSVTGVTMTADEDGNRLIPKRDVRDGILHGEARD